MRRLILLFFILSMSLYAQRIVKIPNSTLIIVKTTEEYTGEKMQTGQEAYAVVAMDVVIEGDTVIKSGAPVFMQTDDASSSGMVGSGGELTLSLRNTTAVDGTNVQLSGTFKSKGESSTGTKVGLGVILCPLFLLGKGDEAVIPAGAQTRAFTIGEYPIKLKN